MQKKAGKKESSATATKEKKTATRPKKTSARKADPVAAVQPTPTLKPAAAKPAKTNALKAKPSGVKPSRVKASIAQKEPKAVGSKKAIAPKAKKNELKPGLRTVYSNSRYTLLPLGFATDFKTKKTVVIFSDLASGQVHTIPLSVWNRWKLKAVKKINTET